MSHYTKSSDGFKEIPLKLTEKERGIIIALRNGSIEETTSAATTHGRGTGRPYVASAHAPAAAGAGAGASRKTYASATRGKHDESKASPERKETEGRRTERTEITEEMKATVDAAFKDLNVDDVKTFDDFKNVTYNNVRVYYIKKFDTTSGSFGCMTLELHGDLLTKYIKELNVPALAIIKRAMSPVYAWLKDETNNKNVLTTIKENARYARCYPDDVLESAEIAFMKGTKILLGKKATKPFDDA
jgi:hypothetical protein